MTGRHTDVEVLETVVASLKPTQSIFEEANYATREEALERITEFGTGGIAPPGAYRTEDGIVHIEGPPKILKVIKRGGDNDFYMIVAEEISQ